MSYNPGDAVHVAGLGKGTVRAVRNGGRYVIELKGRTVVASASQLRLHEAPKENRRGVTTTTAGPTVERRHAPGSIDLHGMTADQAIAALDVFLSEAMLASLDVVRIVHGRSGGRLKMAVHARLRLLPSVRGFQIDPSNPGVTIVRL